MFYGQTMKSDYRTSKQKTGDVVLGERMRKFRNRLNLSQTAAAEAAGLKREIYCHYENGTRNLQEYNRQPIAEALKITVGQLMGTEPFDWGQPKEDESVAEKEEEKIKTPSLIQQPTQEEIALHSNPDVVMTIEEITPEIAQKYLDSRRKKNRGTPPTTIEMYARAMASDAWMLTGESVKFSRDGHLIDGQHRMLAVVKAGETNPKIKVKMFVARNVDEECIFVIDTGRVRTSGDALAINGIKNAYLVSAAMRKLVWFALDDFRNTKISIAEVNRLIHLHPRMAHSVTQTIASRVIPASSLAVLHYIGTVYQNKGDLANHFARTIITGEHASPKDPAWVLRERVSAMNAARAGGKKKEWSREELNRTAAYAWMRFSEGRQMERITTQSAMDLPGWTIAACFGGEAPDFKGRKK